MARGWAGLLCTLVLCTWSGPHESQQPHVSRSPQDVGTESSAKRLHTLFDDYWQFLMQSNPEWATALGDKRYNDRLGEYSAAFFQRQADHDRSLLAQIEAIEPSGLSVQDALSRTLLMRTLREQIDGAQFKPWEMQVAQNSGPQIELTELTTITPFGNAKDYENYIARLREIPRVFNEVTANLRQGLEDGLMPPRFLLEKVVSQAEDVALKVGESSPFYRPLKGFPEGVPAADQKRLRTMALAAVSESVIPAYKQFAAFIRNDYAPRGRTEPGVWALPDGEKRYREQIRRYTTTDLTADQIHEIGLKEIRRTEVEMLTVAHKFGFNDLASFNAHIKSDRTLYATSGQQLFDLYAKYAREMEPELPRMFGHLPKARLIAVPMETTRAKNAVPADYNPGTADGSRPGHINVNEWDPEHRLLLNLEAIAYHEGIPGHHLQISLAQELTDLPEFRRHGTYTAFIEGWALYSERLSKELGKYQDPYSEYGRLENEMWRDVRLVVDTGVHSKHWSREQMVDYFHKYTAMDEPNVQTEVDRYISWPGQALAYKIGQLEILRLRSEAEQTLGNKFDLRKFHDELLDSGPLPLDVLRSQIESWISQQTTAQ